MLETQQAVKSDDEIRQLKAQLLQAQRLASLGVLTSSLAHEFNNYLTTIINYAKLGKANPDPDTRDKAFEKILSASQKAADITSGVLGLSRGQAQKRHKCNIVELVRQVLPLVEKDLSKHRVRHEARFEGEPHSLVCPAQIQQIVLNLVINARQAMPRGGHLRIEVRENTASGMVEIKVADTGEGIPPEKLRSIFQPFYTTKEGPDDTGKGGTGIGLAVCRDIIMSHDGRIRVDSVPGRGTTFTIKLPAVL